MNPKATTNATKKQNNGNRPVCTMFVANQLDMGPRQTNVRGHLRLRAVCRS